MRGIHDQQTFRIPCGSGGGYSRRRDRHARRFWRGRQADRAESRVDRSRCAGVDRDQPPGLSALGKPDGDNWFDLISAGGGAATVKAGQSASARVTLTTALKYTAQPIKFVVASGLPTGATATFSQGALTADGQTTVTIATRS